MDRLLYIHRVAKTLDCSRPMVYKLIYEGKLKAIRIGKRGLRISEASLEQFLEENTVDPDNFMVAAEYDNEMSKGDIIVIPLNSKQYHEFAGARMEVVSTNRKGVHAKREGERGAGFFFANGFYNIPKDCDRDIHGG